MPARPTKNKSQFATQVDTATLDAFRAYCDARGEKFAHVVERAFRREMAYPPPPPEVPPLPDVPPQARPRGRPRKSS